MKILMTGVTGFVGGAVARQLSLQTDIQVLAAVRHQSDALPQAIQQCVVSDLSNTTDYADALSGVDVVIHCAARVHVMNDDSEDPLTEFRKVNVDGTLNLARQAVDSGVKRFVFISSIKVNGEATNDRAFTPNDMIQTHDPYALSKWEAEQGLFKLAETTNMEVVVIRPPLIYGSGVKANFKKMMQVVEKGLPLPLGAVHNQRSRVALDNLVDFICLCTKHPKAANEVFLISDGEDVSTTELLQKVAKAMDKKVRLIPVPVSFMRFIAKLLGKSDVADRLFGSLQIDSSKARNLLGWQPVITMDEQLTKIVKSKQ
ncbi:MAG: SDR family oxidoreductase [Mariprofundaceae bacterium]|nr:SDR family oxidoreductase [Mariprofundaceae bacterium]